MGRPAPVCASIAPRAPCHPCGVVSGRPAERVNKRAVRAKPRKSILDQLAPARFLVGLGLPLRLPVAPLLVARRVNGPLVGGDGALDVGKVSGFALARPAGLEPATP